MRSSAIGVILAVLLLPACTGSPPVETTKDVNVYFQGAPPAEASQSFKDVHVTVDYDQNTEAHIEGQADMPIEPNLETGPLP